MSLANLALLLFAVGCAALAQLLLRHGMRVATDGAARDGAPLAVKAARSPFVLLGLGVFGVSALAWLATLSRLPLSIAYPFNALGYLVILGSSVLLLHERANIWTWLGTACVVFGLLVVVLTRPPRPVRPNRPVSRPGSSRAGSP